MSKNRVIAIQSLENGVLKTYGEGELLIGLVPNIEPFKELNAPNPCIKLDTGKHVWGFECWWGDAAQFRTKYSDSIKSEEIVDVENEVLPVTPEEMEKMQRCEAEWPDDDPNTKEGHGPGEQ